LSLDGQSLLDLPLLERKRLLDSVVVGSDLVRASPYVRPPLERWLPSWQAVGFKGAVLKAANSRYEPGLATDQWTVAQPPQRR
jgi:bifunctional non-homologous end joining protein LigD